jgi:hypothetical protein
MGGEPGQLGKRTSPAHPEPVQCLLHHARVAGITGRGDPGKQHSDWRRRTVQRMRQPLPQASRPVASAHPASQAGAGAGAVRTRLVPPARNLRHGTDPVHLTRSYRPGHEHLPPARIAERGDPQEPRRSAPRPTAGTHNG